ncbi:ROP-interactive CRIB motif-containing protein [Artemisia annua]|uniref:ROP-interactive CRIB motif-containing protein n=1 Tax=Artemisia annua TaxID=35608 RepID=A0A2U1NB80_ARTAN|nr:ROP-interactive CRIB motif-containing protein [Artemisia annua]
MAFTFFTLTFILTLLLTTTNSQPSLNSVEQEALYRVLDSLNSNIPWRTLFPDDICTSPPHGVVCGYTTDPGTDPVSDPGTVNIIELNFGWCFTHRPISLNGFLRSGSGLEELVLVQNPSIYGSLTLVNGENMKGLRRLVITGSNVSGEIPSGFGELSNLEEVTLSRNNLAGNLPQNLSNLKKVKVVDFSQNGLEGNIPENIGDLENLVKLDLSFNKFSGEFPVSMKGLRSLEFLDLSYNNFYNIGIPLVLKDMSNLKGVYLSGNELGGVIPDIWGKLRGLNEIGLSSVGLVGNIPSSMGVYLGNLTYLALDNNKLMGSVPMEFERLEKLNELNLMNNSLSGMLPFSAKFVTRVGGKLKVQGNGELCVDERVIWSFAKVNGNLGKLKVCKSVKNPISALIHVSSGSSSIGHQVSYLMVMFVWILFM